jgi:hypothetical protein
MKQKTSKYKEKLALLQTERIKHYKAHRNKVGEALLRVALRATASIHAVASVNEILDRFGLYDVKLASADTNVSIENILRAEIATILAENSVLPPAAIADFTRRFVAQTIPTKDDVMVPPMPRREELKRIETLESAMKREAARLQAQDRQRIVAEKNARAEKISANRQERMNEA